MKGREMKRERYGKETTERMRKKIIKQKKIKERNEVRER